MMKVCRLVRSTHLQGTSLRPLVPPFDRSSKHFASPSWMFFVIHATNHTENPLRQHFSPPPSGFKVRSCRLMDSVSIPSSCSLISRWALFKGRTCTANWGKKNNPIGVMTHPMKISGSGPPCHRYSKKDAKIHAWHPLCHNSQATLTKSGISCKKIGDHWREFLGSNTWEAKQWHAPVVCLVYTPICSMGLQN